MCADLCAVDYLTHPGRRLPEGVAPSGSRSWSTCCRSARPAGCGSGCRCPPTTPWSPTLFDLYPGTEAMEREAYDLFGIVFDGHPDMTRILLPEDWEGHPLRKDYGVGRVPVQFKGAPGPR